MIILVVLLFASLLNCQWAFLGGSKQGNDRGSYAGDYMWPAGRANSGFIYENNELIVFAGNNIGFSDLWILDMKTFQWTLFEPNNSRVYSGSLEDKGVFSPNNWPVPLEFVSMFKYQNLLYVFPSYDYKNPFSPTLYIYNSTSNLWLFDYFKNSMGLLFTKVFSCYNIFFDREMNSFYMFGAEERILIANMTSLEYAIDMNFSWPKPSCDVATALDGNQMYVFGGIDYDTNEQNDVYRYDVKKHLFSKLNKYNLRAPGNSNRGPSGVFSDKYLPSVRASASLCLDKTRNRLFMFGGYMNTKIVQAYSDLWAFNITSNNWAYIAGSTLVGSTSVYGTAGIANINNRPGQRNGCIFFYDEQYEIVYLFGGVYYTKSGESIYLNEFWAYYLDRSSSLYLSNTFSTKYSQLQRTELIISASNTDSKPLMLTYIVASVGSLLVLVVLAIIFRNHFQTCMLKFKRSKTVEDDNEIDLSNESKQLDTLINTNIGLSNHLFLQYKAVDFATIKKLSEGAQGEIHLVKIMNSKLALEYGTEAVQKIYKYPSESKKLHLHELSIMAMLKKYPYFASIVAYTEDPLSIVMKYYPEGSLFEWKNDNPLSRRIIMKFSFEISSAINTMHNHHLAHCDLKSQNILIEIVNGSPSCCLTDFGITQVLSDRIISVRFFNVAVLRGLSMSYASPESIENFKKRNNWNFMASDRYSLACVMYEILTGRPPWK